MGLLDVLNGMQQGPRGQSNPSAQGSGGMSPMTMAILALRLQGSQTSRWQPARRDGAGAIARHVNAGAGGGGLGDLLKGDWAPARGRRRRKRNQRGLGDLLKQFQQNGQRRRQFMGWQG